MNQQQPGKEQARRPRGRPSEEYQPPLAEIQAMCLLIQDEWSERERRSRESGGLAEAELLSHWSVHEVRWIPPAVAR
jgi:hypothetical protein